MQLAKGRNVTENKESNVRPVITGAVVAMLLALGAYVLFAPRGTVPQLPESQIPVVEAEPVQTEPVVAVEPEAEPTVAEPTVAETPPEPARPTFDTFRVEPDGTMVIAGRAVSGQVVDIILAGKAIERVTADAGGTFVALLMAGPSDHPRRLSLLADPDGLAIASETSYIVAPIAPPVVVAAVPEVEDVPIVPEAAQTPAVPSVEVEPVVAAQAPAVVAPTVLEADSDGVRVVRDGSEDAGNVALDAITYDPNGEVQLAGRATGDGAVQVYINNEPVTTSEVTKGGDWQIALPEIETGVYTLRIDEVDTSGAVVSRLETPFKREEPAEVAAVLAEETAVDGFEVAVRTVQPGSTLWAIAEENLGAGILYVKVFEANSDLIRDPDLIYPGQIFRIPEITE